MKKILLVALLLAGVSLSLNAQTDAHSIITLRLSSLLSSAEIQWLTLPRLAELSGESSSSLILLPPLLQRSHASAPPARNAKAINPTRSVPLSHPDGKFDPFLRILLKRARESSPSLRSFNLAPYAPLLAVYEGELPVRTHIPLKTLSRFTPPTPAPEIPNAFGDRLGVLIKTKNGLPPRGVPIDSQAGKIFTARLPLEALEDLRRDPQVQFIQAGHRLVPTLDESVPAVNADKLRTGRPSASGQGVLIGIVDTGLDYDHLDFRYDRDGDGFEESTRILYIWDQTETYAGRSPPGFGYGTEYTRAQIETDIANGCQLERDTDCLVQARDEIGHGTHVTGIAAGDGSAAGSPFIGVAPESDLLFVKTTYFENQIIDAVQYILERARRLGRPVVVNLSLGGHFGPHDGTSAFEQGLAALVGKPGQILVTSAGNEGNDKVHAGCRFFVDCHNAQGLIGNTATYHFVVGSDRRAFINFWYPLTARYTVTLTAPDGVALMTVFTGQLATRRRPHGEITVDNASSGPDPRNGLNPLTILIEGAQSGDAWEISIQIEEEGGRFDGWPGLASMGYFQEGDTLMTISEPGNTAGLITVGAYTTKEKWESIEGRAFQFQDHRQRGELAVFSSHGPTRDGRAKPDLTAPGTAIISSLAAESEFAHNPSYRALIVPDGQHSALQGTSMSAPHVSGAVAIMLQTNPRLTAREALLKLQSTSQGDEFTRICPDLQDPRTQPLRWCWGAGKLEALRSVDTLGLEPAQFGQRPQVKLGPNPATERVTFFYSLPPRNAFGDPAESVELWVYEITGRLVHRRRLEARASRSEWDLADEKGRPLPNGLYVIVLAADGTRSDVHRLIIRRR